MNTLKGKRLSALLKGQLASKGMSIRFVCDSIDRVIGYDTLAQIFRGERGVSPDEASKIGAVIGLSRSKILSTLED